METRSRRFGHRFPKGEKLSPSPSEALLSGASLEYAERSDSSIGGLSHRLSLYLAQSLANRLDGICLGVCQCRCSVPRHPCRCLLSCGVRLLCGGETGTAHIKQCVSKIAFHLGDGGANPPHNPSLKNKKAVYNCARSEPCLISLATKALGKAERMCKRPKFIASDSNAAIITTECHPVSSFFKEG